MAVVEVNQGIVRASRMPPSGFPEEATPDGVWEEEADGISRVG